MRFVVSGLALMFMAATVTPAIAEMAGKDCCEKVCECCKDKATKADAPEAAAQ